MKVNCMCVYLFATLYTAQKQLHSMFRMVHYLLMRHEVVLGVDMVTALLSAATLAAFWGGQQHTC